MSNMNKYYLSRTLIALAFGVMSFMLNGSWPRAIGLTLGAMAVFLYLPRSGRYVIRDGNSLAPFRDDEYSRAIRNRAGMDGFVTLTLGFFLLHVYSVIAKTGMSVESFTLLFGLGWLVFLISDFWRRRA